MHHLDEACSEYPTYDNKLLVEELMLLVAGACTDSSRGPVFLIALEIQVAEPFTEAVEAAVAEAAGDPGFSQPRRY